MSEVCSWHGFRIVRLLPLTIAPAPPPLSSRTIHQDGSKGTGLFDSYLPGIRVFSILFILYISLFWVRYQMGDGVEWGNANSGRSNEELMRLYGVSGWSASVAVAVRISLGYVWGVAREWEREDS